MEAFELECENLRKKMREQTQFERQRIDEEVKRAVASEARKRGEETSMKIDELNDKLAESERQLKESQFLAEKRAEDNFNLKERIESQRFELDKMRKRAETLED